MQRENLQSSIQRNFDLNISKKTAFPKEQGMANLMHEVYTTYSDPLTHEMLFKWHDLLMQDSGQKIEKGPYRTHKDPMQIVSGGLDKQLVYFEAPHLLGYMKK